MKFICFILLVVVSLCTSANAMGDREKGALIGAGGVIILHQLFSSPDRNQPTQYNQHRYDSYDRHNYDYRRYEHRRVPVCREYRHYEYDMYGRPFEVMERDCR